MKKEDLNPALRAKLNSGVPEMLGFTKQYMEKYCQFEADLPDAIVALGNEIAIVSAYLNHLSVKFNQQVGIERVKQVENKRQEWAEMVARERAERIAKQRVREGKKLKGWEKKIYKEKGLLPDEFMAEMFQKMREAIEKGLV